MACHMRVFAPGWICLLISFTAGCSYDPSRFVKPYSEGKLDVAVAEVAELARKARPHDKVLFFLEQGAVVAAGDLNGSNRAFDAADDLIEKYDQGPEVKILQEVFAAVTNLTQLEYRGFGYDRIMLKVYKALNCLEQGDVDQAHVALRGAYEQQKRSVDRAAVQIEQANQARQQERGKAQIAARNRKANEASLHLEDLWRQLDGKEFKEKYEAGMQPAGELAAYAPYVNPFAEWLQGILFLWTDNSPSGREQAITLLSRTAKMVSPGNYVQHDLQLAERLPPGKSFAGAVTYVIFESGLAPSRGTFFIGLLIPTDDPKKPLPITMAFPRLLWKGNHLQDLAVRTSAGLYPLKSIASMDSIIAREFADEQPIIILRTVIGTIAKALITYASYSSGNAYVMFGTVVANIMLTQADTRTWNTLPKEFSIARLATPPDRRLYLALPAGPVPAYLSAEPIQIAEGTVNVIYIKSIQAGLPLIVRQFRLK